MLDCDTCGREMRKKGTPPDGRPEPATKTTCHACYQRARRRAAGARPRSSPVFRAAVLDDYRLLRSSGVPTRFMPARVGMSPAAFERALYRARAAGDPRALDWKGMAA